MERDSREGRAAERNEQRLQMINFTLGGDEYAVEIQKVREVINFRELTPLPKAPSFVKGIINLRGEVIPVIDLREKLGLAHEAYSALTNVIIVEIGRKAVGVVVDDVRHVIRLAPGEVAPSPPFIGGLSGKYVSGVAKIGERLVVVLDMERILSASEMIALRSLPESAFAPEEAKQ
jgi:purine-binding chemotaxis protein CheW